MPLSRPVIQLAYASSVVMSLRALVWAVKEASGVHVLDGVPALASLDSLEKGLSSLAWAVRTKKETRTASKSH